MPSCALKHSSVNLEQYQQGKMTSYRACFLCRHHAIEVLRAPFIDLCVSLASDLLRTTKLDSI